MDIVEMVRCSDCERLVRPADSGACPRCARIIAEARRPPSQWNHAPSDVGAAAPASSSVGPPSTSTAPFTPAETAGPRLEYTSGARRFLAALEGLVAGGVLVPLAPVCLLFTSRMFRQDGRAQEIVFDRLEQNVGMAGAAVFFVAWGGGSALGGLLSVESMERRLRWLWTLLVPAMGSAAVFAAAPLFARELRWLTPTHVVLFGLIAPTVGLVVGHRVCSRYQGPTG